MILHIQGLRHYIVGRLKMMVFCLAFCLPQWLAAHKYSPGRLESDGLPPVSYSFLVPGDDSFLFFHYGKGLSLHDFWAGAGTFARDLLVLDAGIPSFFFRSPAMALLLLGFIIGLIFIGCRFLIRRREARREPRGGELPDTLKEWLSSGIAQEVRKPLTTILELSEQLSATDLAPGSEKLVKGIQQNSEQLLDRVNRLLGREEIPARTTTPGPVQTAQMTNIAAQDQASSKSASLPGRSLKFDTLPAAEDEFLKKVLVEIEANVGNHDFTVADLCRAMAISKSQMHRKLKELTGQSANRLIRSVRLGKACRLLQDTALNISEVAFRTGFRDPAYFSRLFNQKMGMAPSEYRELGQNGQLPSD